MLTKNAVGNLINRYKAVLDNCRLMNTFGTMALVGMMALGGVGGTVHDAWATTTTITEDTTIDTALSINYGDFYNAGDYKITVNTGGSVTVASGSTTIGTPDSDPTNGLWANSLEVVGGTYKATSFTLISGGTLTVSGGTYTATKTTSFDDATLTVSGGTYDASGFSFYAGTNNTINIGANGTLKANLAGLGTVTGTSFSNGGGYTFGDTAGMLILTNSDVTGMTTTDYDTVLNTLKDKLVDGENDGKTYTGSVVLGGVTWTGLTALSSVAGTLDEVVSGNGTISSGTKSVSGIVGDATISDSNTILTLTGTMGGVDVAVLDGGTLNNNNGTLNIGTTGSTTPLLFNGNLVTSNATTVYQQTIFTGTTTLSGGALNVSGDNTTFGTTEVTGGALFVHATASNTKFGTTTLSSGDLKVNASGTTFGATSWSGGKIEVSAFNDDLSSAIFASLTNDGASANDYLISRQAYVQVTAGLDTGLTYYVSNSSVLNSGAALAQADLDAMTAKMGLTKTAVDGGFVIEDDAVFVHNTGKTLDMTGGTLVVDASVGKDGKVGGNNQTIPSDVHFGTDSALIVNLAGFDPITDTNTTTDAVIKGNGSTTSIHVDADSKLGLMGVKEGTYTILEGFAQSSEAGWAEDNVYALNALFEIEDTLKDASNGAYKVTISQVSAKTVFEKMDKNLAASLDSYTTGTNAFLDKALATSATNKAATEQSIEGAAKPAVASGLGAALGHVGTASVGNIEMRNGSATVFSENDTRFMLAMAGDGAILPVDESQEGFGIWFMPMYKHSSADGFESGNYNYGYDTDIYGATLGADYTFTSSLRLGLAFNVGTGDSESTGDFDTTKNDFDYFGLTAYGNMRFGKLALSADLGYTASSNDIDQDNAFGRLTADADASLLSAGLKGEYEFAFDSFNLTPYAGVRVNYYNIDSFDTKHQGFTAATTAESDYTLVEFPVGLTFDTTLQSGSWDITPSLGLGVKFAAGDLDMDQKVRYTGAQSAMLTSEVADAVTFQGALGLGMKKDVYSVDLGYTLDLSENVQSHGVQVNLRYEF